MAAGGKAQRLVARLSSRAYQKGGFIPLNALRSSWRTMPERSLSILYASQRTRDDMTLALS